MSRFALTPFGIRAILTHNDQLALVLCLLASLSDFADGFAARLLKAETRLGAVLDPLADKFMLNALYLTLWFSRGIGLAALVLIRDLVILAGSAFVHYKTGRKDFPPSRWGKISTVFQMTWIVAYLGDWPGVEVLRICTILLTVFSGLDYIRLGSKMLRGMRYQEN